MGYIRDTLGSKIQPIPITAMHLWSKPYACICSAPAFIMYLAKHALVEHATCTCTCICTAMHLWSKPYLCICSAPAFIMYLAHWHLWSMQHAHAHAYICTGTCTCGANPNSASTTRVVSEHTRGGSSLNHACAHALQANAACNTKL